MPDLKHHRRDAKTQLDATVVGIELTLISIIQGLALGVLAAASITPLMQWQWHLLAIALSLLFSVNYLHGGVRLLRRRQDWIVERNAQERSEAG